MLGSSWNCLIINFTETFEDFLQTESINAHFPQWSYCKIGRLEIFIALIFALTNKQQQYALYCSFIVSSPEHASDNEDNDVDESETSEINSSTKDSQVASTLQW